MKNGNRAGVRGPSPTSRIPQAYQGADREPVRLWNPHEPSSWLLDQVAVLDGALADLSTLRACTHLWWWEAPAGTEARRTR